MWLFDDILKKPAPSAPVWGMTDGSSAGSSGASGQGSGSGYDPLAGPVNPIKIEKTLETSIMTEAPAQATTPNSPAAVSVMADDDASSILISSSTPTPQVSPVVEIISSEPSPVIMMSEPTSMASSPIVTIEETPIVEGVVPAVEPQVSSAPDFSGLFGESPAEAVVTPVVESPVVAPVVESLFWVSEPTPVVAVEKEEEVEEALPSDEEDATFDNPEAFILASITKIEHMIRNIDAAHQMDLDKAKSYKEQKEKYAALEAGSYEDAARLDAKRAHAEKMKKYFHTELTKAENIENSHPDVSAVESTLTGIVVNQSISDTMDRPQKAHKTKQVEHA
jgi:hypothetical protein